MKIGSYVEVEDRGSSVFKSVDIIVDESKLFWYVGERRTKFHKERLTTSGSTKWYYKKIREISKEEYDSFLTKKKKMIEIDNLKSNIQDIINNSYFFKSISYEELIRLNTVIEEINEK